MKITKKQLEKLVESIINESHYDKDDMIPPHIHPGDNRGQIAPGPSQRRKVPTKKIFEILALIPKMTPEQLERIVLTAQRYLELNKE